MIKYLLGSRSALTSSNRSDLPSKLDISSSRWLNPTKLDRKPPMVNFTVTVALTEMDMLVAIGSLSGS